MAEATAAAAAASGDSMTAAAADGTQAAGSPSSLVEEPAPTSRAVPASADLAPTTAGSLRQQLQTIQEQQPQQEEPCPASSQAQLDANGSCSAAAVQEQQLSSRPASNVSELSESDLALLESPFAITANGQFSADLAGAGLIPESEEELFRQTAAAANGAAHAPAAGRAGSGSSATCKRAKSVPASAAAAAAADAAGEGQQQQLQQLRQRASCSVLPRRLTTRPSATPGYKMKPLQVCLSGRSGM